MKAKKRKARDPLRARLQDACLGGGGVVFGIASVKAVDELPRIKIGWTINRYTVPMKSVIPGAKSVIVFGVLSADDSDEIEVIRSKDDYTYPGYLPLKIIRRDIISILRAEGYTASMLDEDKSTTSYKRIAQLAGIGGFGKNSLIISPKYGPWLRIGLVLTDAELDPDEPYTMDLCGDCDECVRACPTCALTEYSVSPDMCLVAAPSAKEITRQTQVLLDEFEPRITAQARVMCRVCQRVCPYTPAERRQGYVV